MQRVTRAELQHFPRRGQLLGPGAPSESVERGPTEAPGRTLRQQCQGHPRLNGDLGRGALTVQDLTERLALLAGYSTGIGTALRDTAVDPVSAAQSTSGKSIARRSFAAR